MGVGIYVLMKDSEGGSREMSLYKEVLVGPELERVCSLSKPIFSQNVLVHSNLEGLHLFSCGCIL